MAQTPALMYSDGDMIDYTPGSAVAAGDVVVIGSRPLVAPQAIAANVKGSLAVDGVFKVPQKAEIQTAGNAVYWDVDGTPVTGDALSGACTATASAGYLMGFVVETTAATDDYCKVSIRGVTAAATVAGAVTATDIEAEDASLGINGLDAAQGGAIAIAGGTSSGGGNAGGAVTVLGGTGGAAGAGGAVSVTGGTAASGNGAGGAASLVAGAGTGSAAGGAVNVTSGAGGATGAGGTLTLTAGTGGTTSGNAGTVVIVGGAGNGTTNGAGGAVSATGGAGKGNLAGGAASLVGGVGGATGAGGAIAVTGGAGGSASGTGGAIVIAGGAGSAGDADGGAVDIRGGAKNGSGANGAINVGADKATTVTIGFASGLLKIVGLPTSDPAVVNQVWANSKVLTLSTGT